MSKRTQKKLPIEPQQATIHALSHDGRGIAHINGKTTFISGALPNETVLFKYLNKRSKFDEGQVETIIHASAERNEPGCKHFAICGGCSLQHLSLAAQIAHKQKILLEQLKHFGGLQPETILPPMTGPNWGYRRKARLGIKFVTKKNTLLIGFREKNGRYLADLNTCEVLHTSVGHLIPTLKTVINELEAYQDIPQIEVAVGDTFTALIFRHLKELTNADLAKLTSFAQQHKIHIYLQPGDAQSVHLLWPADTYPRLSYQLPQYQLELLFHPTDFTQVNADINQKMVSLALELLAPAKTDHVLDLFCGLGNFSLPLAQQSLHVVGVEGDANMVSRAQENARHNRITNAEFYAANLAGNFSHDNWAKRKYHKILLDPPRSGALEVIQQFPQFGAQRIVYVSCNPATLARDAGELIKQGYKLLKAGVMDMFPHTSHVESIALFEKG